MLKDGKVFAAGNAQTVLNPETIRTVYGVNVTINQTNNIQYIIPLEPLH
jgi:ABC-type cobalamin/Fe3+-siderophores transport system ATPase subunit